MNLPSLSKVEKLVLIAILFVFFISSITGGYIWLKNRENFVSSLTTSNSGSERSLILATPTVIDDKISPTSSASLVLNFTPDQLVVKGELKDVTEKNLVLTDKNGQTVMLSLEDQATIVEINSENKWEKKDLDFLRQNLGIGITVDLFLGEGNVYKVRNIVLER